MAENQNTKEQYLRKRYQRYYTWIGPIMDKPQTKAYTFLALSFLTVAFFIFFAIRPTINTIVGLRKQIEDNQMVEKKLQDKINALSQLQAEYEVIQKDLPYLNSALPTTVNVVDLVKNFERLVSENHASLSAMQIAEAPLSENSITVNKNKNTAIPLAVIFSIEGDYMNMANLVESLNNLPRIISVQSLSLIKGVGKVIGSLKVNAYYLPSE